nr:LysR substrate-binding domain-containing protein [uncultured Albidiferax sp.]
MDIRQLRYFIRVVELGSFSRAALVLGICQPSISRQIRQLEVELRQTLLIRNGRGVEPTEAGKVLLELGRGILHQMDRVYEELGRVEGKLAGRVSVGLPPTWARLVVLPFTRLLQREMPYASVAVIEGPSVSMRGDLLCGKLDIALLYDPLPTPDLEFFPLKNEELFVISSRDDKTAGLAPLTLAQLATMPLVIPGRPNPIRMLLEREACAMGLGLRIAYEIEGIGSILELVRSGAGHAVLSIASVQTLGHAGAYRCQPVGPDGLKIRLMLAVSARRASTHTQKAAFTFLAELVRATNAQLPSLQDLPGSADIPYLQLHQRTSKRTTLKEKK